MCKIKWDSQGGKDIAGVSYLYLIILKIQEDSQGGNDIFSWQGGNDTAEGWRRLCLPRLSKSKPAPQVQQKNLYYTILLSRDKKYDMNK